MAPVFHIRQATPDDVDIILQLIIDLATYEKEPESVKATPELLHKNLFETPYAHALLAFSGTAETPAEPIGLALYFFNFSTWTGKPGLYLEDLYVKPEHRSLGVGKAFFGQLGKIAQEKWNQPSIDFYEKRLGATPMSEWMGMRLEGQGIKNLNQFL
ncbi:Thialysine N-epsilon-acetyltransferase [Psilocybe cubensis]|uniref:Thialysine N-epsilon-acetyltransferase n=1 Tax=Psilocybe cubensis TaxID=181762 RepID=A0ACB8GSW3_PSICU|nr:Thialysine N-epsilon-acetyltransferase [Psilocybe cubensis]KAH9478666.1 Thialysine N-epsilon-acetyltransferase [Psilocybe cubensis]